MNQRMQTTQTVQKAAILTFIKLTQIYADYRTAFNPRKFRVL